MPNANQRRREIERTRSVGGLLPESTGTRGGSGSAATPERQSLDVQEAYRVPDPDAPPNPVEACDEAAARLQVVIKMLHDSYCERLRPGDAEGSRAYGERQVADGLREIRNLLKASIRDSERRRAS